jgi:hypothetical protein
VIPLTQHAKCGGRLQRKRPTLTRGLCSWVGGRYLCDPLRKCLKDDDPYVRKTAAVCVAKLYDIDQTLVLEQGFIESLQVCTSFRNSSPSSANHSSSGRESLALRNPVALTESLTLVLLMPPTSRRTSSPTPIPWLLPTQWRRCPRCTSVTLQPSSLT